MTRLSYEAFLKVLEESAVICTLDEGVIVGGAIEDTDISVRVQNAYEALFPSVVKSDTVVVQPMFTNYTALGNMPYVDLGRPKQQANQDPSGDVLDWIPKYQSFKIVQAFKIKSIVLVEGGYRLEAEDSPHGVLVDKAYFDKHQPKTGGYYVHYQDGYRSWSPALTFESSYVLLEEDYCPPRSMSLEDHVDEAIEAQHPKPTDALEDPDVNLDKDA